MTATVTKPDTINAVTWQGQTYALAPLIGSEGEVAAAEAIRQEFANRVRQRAIRDLGERSFDENHTALTLMFRCQRPTFWRELAKEYPLGLFTDATTETVEWSAAFDEIRASYVDYPVVLEQQRDGAKKELDGLLLALSGIQAVEHLRIWTMEYDLARGAVDMSKGSLPAIEPYIKDSRTEAVWKLEGEIKDAARRLDRAEAVLQTRREAWDARLTSERGDTWGLG